MKADQFEVISEPCSDNGAEMLDGCGFIPDSMLLEIVEKMGKASGGLMALREMSTICDHSHRWHIHRPPHTAPTPNPSSEALT